MSLHEKLRRMADGAGWTSDTLLGVLADWMEEEDKEEQVEDYLTRRILDEEELD